MTESVDPVASSPELPVRHQLGKLIAGVVAGFFATKIVEKKYVELFGNKSTPVADSDQ